jgi:hypothetical protein
MGFGGLDETAEANIFPQRSPLIFTFPSNYMFLLRILFNGKASQI